MDNQAGSVPVGKLGASRKGPDAGSVTKRYERTSLPLLPLLLPSNSR